MRADGAIEVHALADAALERCLWAVYRVRRCYTAPAKAWRSVQIVHRADRAEATALMTGLAAHLQIRLRTDGEHTRLWLAPPSTEFPRLEEFFVAAPDSVIEKRRLNFETRWHGHADTALLTLEHRAALFCDSRTARAA